jgi:hypothetical protein
MNRKRASVVVLIVVLTFVSVFSIFVPIIPQQELGPCYDACSASVQVNYTVSISYHLTNTGAVADGCGYHLAFEPVFGLSTTNPKQGPYCLMFGGSTELHA